MEQALRRRGQDEQSADQFKVVPDGETDQHVDEGQGHGKKSMLNKMKDKAKTMKTKVKKTITPHHEESQEDSQEATSEEWEGEDVEEHHQTGDKTDVVEKPLKPTEETPNLKTGGVNAEAPEPRLGLGKMHQIQEQGEEEKPMSTRSGESIPGTGEYKSEDNFHTTPENTESGKAWNQSSSEGADRGKENAEEFGVYKGKSSPEKPGEEQFQSPEGKVNDNVKESPEKVGLGKTWSERASEGFGFAREKLQGYGGFTSIKSAAKPEEESQSSLGHGQDKVNEIGEGKEMGSDMKSPTNTEEIKTDPSETGPGYVREASMPAEESKKDFSFDQTSSNDKAKDTVIEGEHKEYEDEGTQQQQSGGEAKAGQSYGSQIYSAKDAISSKLGFGGQTNQEPNVIGETKPDDQIQGKEMDIDTKSPSSTEETKTGPSETDSGYVKETSKLAEEFKKGLSFDQTSSSDKAKDTLMEGENKENGDEGTQQQPSGGEGKEGQSYVSKIYSAKDVISSKLGYGGQTNHQEPNVIGESKPADQTPRTATESMEGKETFKSTIVSKLSPGEDDKALSEVITGAVSNRAKSLKDSLGGLYGGNGKVSTTDTNTGAPGIDNQNTASSPSAAKGIVNRVTGVVGSFFGSKQGDNSEQHSASEQEKSEPKSQVQVEEQVPEAPKY